MKIKVLASEAACGVGTGNGSNFSSATHVRVFNDSTSRYLVSVEDSSNTLIGTFHLNGGAAEIVVKNPSDEIFAEYAAVLAVPIAVEQ